ncbi:MAG: HAD-IA family hydrolase [Deltaproteobacteria bacterium]|nr:HAD-IA family hydrolase [Deltaproteobacteria bacterium]
MTIKAVFFDAAGTLIRPVRRVGESYALTARKYGMEAPAEEIGQRFRSCFSSAPPLAFPGAQARELKGLERQWWEELVRRVFEPYGPFPRFEDYFSELFSYFGRPDSWSLYPETVETLAALKERGLILDVLSNFDSRLIGILDGLGIASCFDSVLLSSHVGYAKPAPEIFQAALGLHQLNAEEALHVGDSLDKDAAGANSAGMMGVLLDRNNRSGLNSFRRVQSLKEILSFLASTPVQS